MATLGTARAAQTAAFEKIREMTGVRPNAVSIVPDEREGFALKIVLPRDPGGEIPARLMDVPLYFQISVAPPTLAAGDAADKGLPDWLRGSKARRSSR